MSNRYVPTWQRRLASARAKQAEWQRKLDDNPDASNHQRGVWRSRVVRYRKDAEALQRRIDAANK